MKNASMGMRPLAATEARAGWHMRVVQIFLGLSALAFAAFVVNTLLSPPRWWQLSGLETDPGNFVAQRPVDYPVCAPWQDRTADFARREWQMTEAVTARAIGGGDAINLGVLLPKSARVLKIYCATGTDECSWASCDPPLTFLAMDSLYTRGRTLIMTMSNQSPRKGQKAQVHLWVFWQ
jgi:hypothetical protein